VQRVVVVATDRSETAARAVRWAADLAQSFFGELVLVQVIALSDDQPEDAADFGRAAAVELAAVELTRIAEEFAGARGRARVVVDDRPAEAIVAVAHEEGADVIVVGNAGMSGNKKFLLSNVPNRITHMARCTVVTVNTTDGLAATHKGDVQHVVRPSQAQRDDDEELLLSGRAAKIARVAAKHGLEELFSRRGGDNSEESTRESARNFRGALEELGPTFCKLGQVLSTRPDLVPPAFIEELATLRDNVPPLTEAQVVVVMEEELQVPWEDVFDSIEPTPLATGSIAQVHRATLSTGEKVVVKVQRPGARAEITRDLGLLEVFARKSAKRPGLRQIVDPAAVVEHLSTSLQSELDFRREADSIARMRTILERYPRLAVPEVYTDFSTHRLLVMQEVGGGPIGSAPEGPVRKDAARQLIESYYRQILTEGFFHADPHPGNLKWWDDKVWFLDFGMVGEVGPELRDGLVMMMLAFWQEDQDFLAETLWMLAGEEPRPDLDVVKFRDDLGHVMARYRHVPLQELQMGPMLQDVTTLAIRYDVPLPATLVLTAKALAQIQHATAELDPEIDPFAVAGSYFAKSALERLRGSFKPQHMLYESQKIRVRLTRLLEAFERLVGSRPGPNLQVQFRGIEGIETNIRRGTRRLAIALPASGGFIATAIMADSTNVASWVAPLFGVVTALLTIGLVLDVIRRRN